MTAPDWQRIATEAAQQSEQWQPPEVLEPLESRRFFSTHKATCSLLLAERHEAAALARIPLPSLPSEQLTVIIGPEGGWAEEEITLALAQQCQAVSLGSCILRADTAAVTALSIVQSRLGRPLPTAWADRNNGSPLACRPPGGGVRKTQGHERAFHGAGFFHPIKSCIGGSQNLPMLSHDPALLRVDKTNTNQIRQFITGPAAG